ncbi:hemerythrin domain-containing protein [Protofrankia symbiont of Coriaria ruscifolia]|uniref:Hemerythrin HHE cation binding domain-containing protein n=1 Tax=Candidatus Protofrankia californiensis TaxID=1839754 RepID=A0A1C3P0U9_9ACTN|nr:hemerythrin domain-containing protein [Protofrankia symbiont of Coriaria ruscifolia]SBW23368.1 hemerythrin HHE cation binding domain-containing protein [Candidatus Protofrankia californiensis]
MTNSTNAGNDHTSPLAGTVDFTMMYAAHAAFTRDLQRLRLAYERGDVRTPAARARWATFTKQIHIHHQAEDTALWPLLRNKALRPDEITVLDEMEAEHAQIDPHLEHIDNALASDNAASLMESIDTFATSLTVHMRHEENEALPLVEAYLGPDGWAAFTATIRKTQGLRGGAEFLPWLLDDASEVIQAKVLGLLPPPVRFLYRRIWAPKYHRIAGITA